MYICTTSEITCGLLFWTLVEVVNFTNLPIYSPERNSVTDWLAFRWIPQQL